MRKKLFKYIKFLISMVLILGLIAPSYASLSASDGSAFVTKAEFDSALADFNSRLTTFEAGINSKIDSQVTSYLDRNGIWNGKEQTLYGGSVTYLFPAPVGLPSGKSNTGYSNIQYGDKQVIFQSNKSGLAVVKRCVFTTQPASSAAAYWGFNMLATQTKNLFDDYLGIDFPIYELDSFEGDLLDKNILYNIHVGDSKTQWDKAILPSSNFTDPMWSLMFMAVMLSSSKSWVYDLFFVAKSKIYATRFVANYRTGFYSDTKPESKWVWIKDTQQGGGRLYIESIYVY